MTFCGDTRHLPHGKHVLQRFPMRRFGRPNTAAPPQLPGGGQEGHRSTRNTEESNRACGDERCSTSANSTSDNSTSANWPKSNWPKSKLAEVEINCRSRTDGVCSVSSFSLSFFFFCFVFSLFFIFSCSYSSLFILFLCCFCFSSPKT